MPESKVKERDPYGNRADDGVRLSTPFGSITAHGPMVISVVLIVCAVATIAFMQRDHDLRQTERLMAISKEREKQVDMVMAQQREFKDSMDSLLYVLALTPEDRLKLKLDMPPALRNRLLTAERGR